MQMPITYSVSKDGHFIHAVADGVVTNEDILAYEIEFRDDGRIKPPVKELLEIKPGCEKEFTMEGVADAVKQKEKTLHKNSHHTCAIVVPYEDNSGWDLANFYSTMAQMHFPSSVIVFGDIRIAKTWLGVESTQNSIL